MAISAIQVAPVKRDDDGTPVQFRDGSHKVIPFTKEQHRMNSAILNLLFKAVDEVESGGKTLITMRDPVDAELSPKQVRYLAKLIMRRCQEYNVTGQHVIDFYDKFEEYSKIAADEMKNHPSLSDEAHSEDKPDVSSGKAKKTVDKE